MTLQNIHFTLILFLEGKKGRLFFFPYVGRVPFPETESFLTQGTDEI